MVFPLEAVELIKNLWRDRVNKVTQSLKEFKSVDGPARLLQFAKRLVLKPL